ncbi:hypothetical protein [Cobetia sp. 1CM21F]|uniref:hypothetical protein n=2 Tax=unclassified Cobetia TaxID=2609414 RepID=UPI0020BD56C0|nr:hypothetical protein [Cobetia sp. 1CM21F]MCK8067962.1 hypothetical protein [Cobetia sp. 1CM21F]
MKKQTLKRYTLGYTTLGSDPLGVGHKAAWPLSLRAIQHRQILALNETTQATIAAPILYHLGEQTHSIVRQEKSALALKIVAPTQGWENEEKIKRGQRANQGRGKRKQRARKNAGIAEK